MRKRRSTCSTLLAPARVTLQRDKRSFWKTRCNNL